MSSATEEKEEKTFFFLFFLFLNLFAFALKTEGNLFVFHDYFSAKFISRQATKRFFSRFFPSTFSQLADLNWISVNFLLLPLQSPPTEWLHLMQNCLQTAFKCSWFILMNREAVKRFFHSVNCYRPCTRRVVLHELLHIQQKKLPPRYFLSKICANQQVTLSPWNHE